jgi:hypothetical protein
MQRNRVNEKWFEATNKIFNKLANLFIFLISGLFASFLEVD